MLQTAILSNNAGHRLYESDLKDIILKEYQILDDKFKISNEYEKSQIISELYKYLAGNLKKYGSFTKPLDNDKLKDDFLKISDIDLDSIINNSEERYKDNRGAHCKYCSSKDVCLRIAQN